MSARIVPQDGDEPVLPELLPCPFCGGRAVLNNVGWVMGRRRVYCACAECRGCGQDIQYRPGPDHGLRDEALYAAACAWNTRAAPASRIASDLEDATRL
ncbi:Lar family restriction alleviation protein [Thauera humireducens]|uniref:Restriction alleviation protein, Lar family n=1 Tax=Thauera humireducens TaxID=1134435 RepID=A0A127K438_9RHOO|nr:Lar family restriction alleviation protein [Thauera humireducens]AMO36731.1 hypothetical protein AC731_007110 [Thauera humireducens]